MAQAQGNKQIYTQAPGNKHKFIQSWHRHKEINIHLYNHGSACEALQGAEQGEIKEANTVKPD
jgi:hypothetical protein